MEILGAYCLDLRQPDTGTQSIFCLLVLLFMLHPGSALSAELQYKYTFSGQTYPTLSSAENAMRSVDTSNTFLKQQKVRFNAATGEFEYTYTVPDRAAIQVGPNVYWGQNSACVSSYCYSEAEAYAAFKLERETILRHCNVVISPTSSFGAESFGAGTNLKSGQVWENGVASTYKFRTRTFKEEYGLINSQGACAAKTPKDGFFLTEWKPWGCITPFNIQTVNTQKDTCSLTTKATITATPIQFCGPETSNPIRPLTGEKVLAQTDIDIPLIRFSRFYHSGLQTLATNRISLGWQHSYSQYLILDTNNAPAYAARENGNLVPLRSVSSTLFVAAGGESLKIEKIAGSYELTLPSNRKEIYNTSGKRLLSVVRPDGHVITLTYDSNSRISQIAADTGESINLSYTQNNQLSSATDHTGRQWLYTYDGPGNLEFVLYPDNTQVQYYYEDSRYPNFVTGVTDRRSVRYSTFAYDLNGRAATSYLGTGIERVDINYGADGIQSSTNSLGVQTQFSGISQLRNTLVTNVSGPGCSTCGTSNTSYIYDVSTNDLLNRTENGITTLYDNYDNNGQYGYKIEAQGTPEQRRADYTYDSRLYNKITSITEPSVFASNPSAQCVVGTDCKITTYNYDSFGNRTSETVSGFATTGTPVTRTTSWQYGGDGTAECNNAPLRQLCRIDGPRTDVSDITTYRYHPNDTTVPVGTRARLREVQDANGVLIRSNIQYTATGKVLSEQRPNGLSHSYTYYPGNDRLQTLTEAGNTGTRITRWTYLATGEVASITTADGTPATTTLTFSYDDARRLIRITDGLGNHIDYTLDTEGNRLAENHL